MRSGKWRCHSDAGLIWNMMMSCWAVVFLRLIGVDRSDTHRALRECSYIALAMHKKNLVAIGLGDRHPC